MKALFTCKYSSCRLLSPRLISPPQNRPVRNYPIYSCYKKSRFINPKLCLIIPIFEYNLLKMGELRTRSFLSCFRRFRALRCLSTVVNNSTVSSQIVYLCRNRYARRQLVLCKIYFQNGEETCRPKLFSRNLEI